MDRPRLVTVEFVNDEGQHRREDYVFFTPEQMVGWLTSVDEPRLPRFGVGAVMTIRYVAMADPPVVPEKKTTRKTTAKKVPKTRAS